MWPYSALTHQDIGPNAVALMFGLIGFSFSLRLFFDLRQRYFPRSGVGFEIVSVLALAFGSATTFLVRRAMFYELPLIAGYAVVAGFFWSLARAYHSRERTDLHLALASLFFGMSVACHPNYIFIAPALLCAAIYRFQKQRRVAYFPAAILPAFLIGCALAWYNYARFGSPFDFGYNYGQNEFFASHDKLLSPAFIWPNLKWYYLGTASFTPYFPYFFPEKVTFLPPGYHGTEAMHGELFFALFFFWIVVGVVVKRIDFQSPELVLILASLVWIGAVNIVFISSFGIHANRYICDFQAPLLLAAIIASGLLFESLSGQTWPNVWKAVWFCGAVTVAFYNICAAVQQFDEFKNTRAHEYALLSRTLSIPWKFLWFSKNAESVGPRRLTLRFPDVGELRGEPLLTTGTPQYTDMVTVIYQGKGQIMFSISRHGYPERKSAIVPIVPGKPYHITVDIGSLYPPAYDPYFASYTFESIKAQKQACYLALNDEVLIEDKTDFNESPPWDIKIGQNHSTRTVYKTDFSGQIDRVEITPLLSARVRKDTRLFWGVVRLKVDFPPDRFLGGKPILETGTNGHGSLIFIRSLDTKKFQIGVDQWGLGMDVSPDFSLAPGKHTFDLVIGPALASKKWPPGLESELEQLKGKIVFFIDGKRICTLSISPTYSDFAWCRVGANLEGFSSANEVFPGQIRREPLADSEMISLLRGATTP
jgi:hypothetical protein